MSYNIVVDACCDLPSEYIKSKKTLSIVPMHYLIDGEEMSNDPSDPNNVQISEDFYEKLNSGSTSTTAQINIHDWEKAFKVILDAGNDILSIAISSELSGTFNSSRMAAENLLKSYPDRKIITIDSLCASCGEGLLVYKAVENLENGLSIDDNNSWIEENKSKLLHWFTVNDLHFLFRGGRVTKSAAYIGSIIRIKPIMHVDYAGKLVPVEKIQGRRHAIKKLCSHITDHITNPEEQVIFIGHGGCLKDAQTLEKMCREHIKVKDIIISPIGPVVGSHTGPGILAIFAFGTNR